MIDRELNPLTWRRRHYVGWSMWIILDALAGLAVGWYASPFRIQSDDLAAMILAWLHYPGMWWRYVLAGAVTGGLAYYSMDLLTGAR
jgi:hypothetical protein